MIIYKKNFTFISIIYILWYHTTEDRNVVFIKICYDWKIFSAFSFLIALIFTNYDTHLLVIGLYLHKLPLQTHELIRIPNLHSIAQFSTT